MAGTNIDIGSIRSITAVVGNWYRVRGTRLAPELDRVAVWALIDLVYVDPQDGSFHEGHGQIIVGVPARDFLVQGNNFSDWAGEVAGYVELSDVAYQSVLGNPQALPQEGLVWEE